MFKAHVTIICVHVLAYWNPDICDNRSVYRINWYQCNFKILQNSEKKKENKHYILLPLTMNQHKKI
jgi:hypothetical protein